MKLKLLITTSFLILTLLSCTRCTAQYPKAIPIKIIGNKTIVPVKVDNSKVLDILLDTGMSFDGLLVYNPDLKEDIVSQNAIKVKVSGAGKDKPLTAMMDTSASYFIGDLELKNQKILMLQNDIYKGFPSDGVLGYSIFGHFAVEIDYDKNVLILHDYEKIKVDETWETIPIYFKHNSIPWIDISVVIENEKPVKISTYIDFAAGENIELLEKENMKFSLPKHLEKTYLGRGLSGDIYGKKGKIAELHIGSYKLKNLEAAFVSATVRSKQKNADGIIGSGSLRQFNLIFNYKHKKLFIKPNSFYKNK